MEEGFSWWNSLKYLVHGVLFSIIYIFAAIFWAFILAFLVVFGFIIGFIIALIVLFFLIGGINAFLTELIWDVPVKKDWKSLLAHGFVMFIALILVHIPAIILIVFVFSFSPDIAVTIALLIIYSFVDGFIAAKVAPWWEEEH